MQKDIGILAAEVYFPRTYIPQTAIEEHYGFPEKYTKGLGQMSMAICDEAEDVVSLSLTVTKRLIERIELDLTKVGFLEVGSETLVDKSKSIKSHLMVLFEESGNFDLAGIDVKSACYGGTAALFNAINWLESSSCDGRLALVVAADIATYLTAATQPTGGAGAVAILLGPNAPLVVDSGLRVCAMRHRYDFCKPVMKSIFPEVDGKLSITCYKEAVLSCYRLYREKVEKFTGRKVRVIGDRSKCEFPIDFVCFHSPFYRLVAKSFGWMVLQDVKTAVTTGRVATEAPTAAPTTKAGVNNSASEFHNAGATDESALVRELAPLANEADSTQISRTVDEACLSASRALFDLKVAPGLRITSEVGNMYTASLYACLISLACSVPEVNLRGRRVLMFSYGSGYTSSMFSLRISETADVEAIFGASSHSPFDRLAQRTPITYASFSDGLEAREAAVDKAPLNYPTEDLEKRFFPGTYYLTHVDEMHRRFYERTPTE
ncbi:Hydroxymethylglutaryl-CoA synthase, cytoplasmic [Echinococcus granulosus]|uniref:Hydroxymethylglutaryl-CoA synthase n=1 Tax=Echinococcus granulosus TaxID=6210 RepID=W6U3Q1_ECHGR|nr:Hydroxymethylglutaryl-CoA synthase, cytoplasmic [Echinococcus granulosus]EUB55728.1 Hydroxymethylglutaryl-CoA synthase, cytoplasmic [Echinococcus granulosus]